jgi:ribosomal protein RSM22 (predicted rRNA methylase)
MTYPFELNAAVTNAITRLRHGSLRGGMEDLSQRYRRGGQSKGADFASYLAARLPATFAATSKVLEQVSQRLPTFLPATAIDVGAGPGTAGWAALQQWSSLQMLNQLESAPDLAQLAKSLNAESGNDVLRNVVQNAQSITSAVSAQTFDLVLASYVLAEVQAPDQTKAMNNLLAYTAGVLIVVEPGTPQGFARILALRQTALRRGLHLVGPCTHELDCPMSGGDWCHFKTRVQRSRDHMHAKAALVPFEDEPFSWVAISRQTVALSGARVIAPPVHTKPGIDLKLCHDGKITSQHIASRAKATYKALKKTQWGDLVEEF